MRGLRYLRPALSVAVAVVGLRMLVFGSIANVRDFNQTNLNEVWALHRGTSLALIDVALASPETWVRTSFAPYLQIGKYYRGNLESSVPVAHQNLLRKVSLVNPVSPSSSTAATQRLAGAPDQIYALEGAHRYLRLTLPRNDADRQAGVALQIGDDIVVGPRRLLVGGGR